MKKKELQEYKNKPFTELKKDFVSYREQLVKLKFDLAAGKVKNIREIKNIKKSIAQILTIIKKYEPR